MDRRLTPFSGRIGHISLRGRIADVPLTEGEAAQISTSLSWLRTTPAGTADRQLIHGDRITVIDRREGYAFVMASKDGYCGWLDETALAPPLTSTHWVRSPATHLYPEPRVQAPPLLPLWLNGQITVTGETGAWAETPAGFIPKSHLAPLDQPAKDPAGIAESLLNAPYLWAGNSAAGVDCSGLVQLSLHAAGLPCPGDSDQQQSVGEEIPHNAPLQRGDLLFWKGHVAMMTSPTRLIHANGYTMSVAYEDLAAATARISSHYHSEITTRRRPPKACS